MHSSTCIHLQLCKQSFFSSPNDHLHIFIVFISFYLRWVVGTSVTSFGGTVFASLSQLQSLWDFDFLLPGSNFSCAATIYLYIYIFIYFFFHFLSSDTSQPTWFRVCQTAHFWDLACFKTCKFLPHYTITLIKAKGGAFLHVFFFLLFSPHFSRDLSNNKLTLLYAGVFDGLSSLQTLQVLFYALDFLLVCLF